MRIDFFFFLYLLMALKGNCFPKKSAKYFIIGVFFRNMRNSLYDVWIPLEADKNDTLQNSLTSLQVKRTRDRFLPSSYEGLTYGEVIQILCWQFLLLCYISVIFFALWFLWKKRRNKFPSECASERISYCLRLISAVVSESCLINWLSDYNFCYFPHQVLKHLKKKLKDRSAKRFQMLAITKQQ